MIRNGVPLFEASEVKMPLSRLRPRWVLSFQYAACVGGDYLSPSREDPVVSGYKQSNHSSLWVEDPVVKFNT